MIEIKDLKVKMKSLEFIFEDFRFEKNKVTVISGRNGAGKTTLLRVFASLLDYEGSLKINAEVTYNSQEPVIFNRSVYCNIVYPLKVRKLDISKYHDKIIEYSKLLDIEHLLDNNALKLSSGEKMKVSIIRSIIFEPDIVLLDEPTTHLDLESISELTQLIKKLKDKITFIIVTHNFTFMEDLVDVEYKVGGKNVLS